MNDAQAAQAVPSSPWLPISEWSPPSLTSTTRLELPDDLSGTFAFHPT